MESQPKKPMSREEKIAKIQKLIATLDIKKYNISMGEGIVYMGDKPLGKDVTISVRDPEGNLLYDAHKHINTFSVVVYDGETRRIIPDGVLKSGGVYDVDEEIREKIKTLFDILEQYCNLMAKIRLASQPRFPDRNRKIDARVK